ncbi:MAG: CHAT domain-containing protein [Acidobacteria bacterium]|nr:CHAT domain-containing protein [Acidobacteriota bacterium]MCW5950318.1 CHAT domain-containing protein [Pyrinomonadaceae bacterium]
MISPYANPRRPRQLPIWKAAFAALIFLAPISAQTSGSGNEIERLTALYDQWTPESSEECLTLASHISASAHAAGSHEDELRAAVWQSRTLRMLGRPVEAAALLNSLLDHPTHRDLPHGTTAEALSELAHISIDAGDGRTAGRVIDRLRKLDTGSIPAADRASVEMAFADHSYYLRNIDDASRHAAAAANAAREARLPRMECEALRHLGYSLMTASRYLDGLKTLEQALELAISSGDRRGTALTRIAIGHILTTIDRKQQAFEAYSAAESMMADGLDAIEHARLANGLGHVYEEYGELRIALSYRQRAAEYFRKGGHRFGELATLPSIGKLYSQLGDNDAAVKAFADATALSFELKDPFTRVVIAKDLGDHYFSVGSLELARSNYLRVMSEAYRFGLIRDKGAVMTMLGRIDLARGRTRSAQIRLAEAAQTARTLLNPMGESDALHFGSIAATQAGDASLAFDLAKRSVEITDGLYLGVERANFRRNYVSETYDRYTNLIDLTLAGSDPDDIQTAAEQALAVAERFRARTLLDQMFTSGARSPADADPEIVNAEAEVSAALRSATDRLTDLKASNAASNELDRAENEIAVLRDRSEQLKAKIRQTSPVYAQLKDPSPFDARQFRSETLDENEVLLEYVLGARSSHLIAVSRESVRSYELPPQQEIDRLVSRSLSLMTDRDIHDSETTASFQQRIADQDLEWTANTTLLSKILLAPAAEMLAGKRLIIVPDGSLSGFPVHALPSPDRASGEKPLIVTNEVIYQPSASILKYLRNNRPSGDAAGATVFADPITEITDERIIPNANDPETEAAAAYRQPNSKGSFPRLPGSRKEAETIVRMLGGAAIDRFIGFDAAVENVKVASRRSILHFAVHGMVDDRNPELSGLALTSYTSNGEPRSPGMLRLNDVYDLDLKADTVILSACETGRGKAFRGDGIVGMNTAFLQSGARSVVSTLWKVDDNATGRLMRAFYAELSGEKRTAAASLRQAQITMIDDPLTSSPVYWAAFVINGDPQTRLRGGTSMPGPVEVLAILSALALVVIRRPRKVPRLFYGKNV